MKKKFKLILLSIILGVLVLGTTGCSYKETDDQAIIYLFRGQGCGFCRNFISFLNSINEEYGKYFKVVSFEVWNDADNSELMNKVATITGVEARGVPYIIIGDKVFDGYIDSYNEDIKKQIMKQYKDNSYDIFEELKKKEDIKDDKLYYDGYHHLNFLEVLDAENFELIESEFSFSNTSVVLVNLLVVILGVVFVSVNSNKNKQEIMKAISKIDTKKIKNEEK